ncbi:unnamed protein product, partial [Schistosoma mattheei]
MHPRFMLLDTRHHSVLVILRELVLPYGFDPKSRSSTIRDVLGTRHQGVPVILRELVLPGGFDLVSHSFTVRDVTTE